MADCEIVVVGPSEIPLLTELYNQVFRPGRDEEFFKRRLRGRYNVLLLVAQLDGLPVGFSTGFELKPNTFFDWLCGVLPEFRRQGIASQLLEAETAWARDHGYSFARLECYNQHRAMLMFCIKHNYDVVGVRWDPDRGDNLVILEKRLTDVHENPED
jgi:GNAT superfamily N-acetyltransferase